MLGTKYDIETIILLLQFALMISFLGCQPLRSSSTECVACHGSEEKMKTLGYPQFYVTQKMVEEQSNHSDVECHECHLGDGNAKDADKAHKGMLKALLVSESGDILERKKVFPSALLPEGDNRIIELLPKEEVGGRFYPLHEVRNLLWHDRNIDTLSFDPEITEKTCGKSNCHPQELEQFKTTIMATNYRQRTMKTWLNPYGPHNCGPSFADIPPSPVLGDRGFDFKNTEEIVKNLNTDFTKEQAMAKQKFCNVCHAGCLDCHYTPSREEGVHSFTKIPPSESCAGGGRGTSMCHSGSIQSRRGETYIGGDYSIPEGMAPDVHYKKNIHCVDCHQTGEKGMGDIQREANCQNCHTAIEKAHAESVHKNLSCATCHISELRGYQITIWGPGLIADESNPFEKFLYYGIQKPPILMKDQKGIWMPVKIWPNSVGNIKNDVPPSQSIQFRWQDRETRDAYYVIGSFDGLPRNNKHLLWLEIEQAAHPFGSSRTCEGCHGEEQVSVSAWEFEDGQGAEPFSGSYKIVADRHGVRIENIRNTTPIKLISDLKVEDFATWIYLQDKWKAPGDFSIKTDKNKYKKSLSIFKETEKELKALALISKSLDQKKFKQYKDVKGAALHNGENAKGLIKGFRTHLQGKSN